MHQAQVSQRSAFQHVLEHHSLELLMSDDDLSQRLVSMNEEVPAPRIIVGMSFPPTKRWGKKESALDYLRILAYLNEAQYQAEAESKTFADMMLIVHEFCCPDLDLDEFALEVDTQSHANKLLTFLTGEEHPLKPMTWEGMFWDLIQPQH
jgi:hypothetical protein